MDRAATFELTRGGVAALALSLLGIALVGAAWSGMPLREIVIVVSLVLAPGVSVASLAGVRDPLVVLSVAVPAGVSVVGLIATILVYVGYLSAELTFVLVAAITVLGSLLGGMERTARALLIGVAALPGLVLLAAELAR